MQSVYLDACCLNRPFDDQRQERIRIESEAVLLILGRIERRQIDWFSSEVLDLELELGADPERRARLLTLAGFAKRKIRVGERELDRAIRLQSLGFGAHDALHVACAESAHVGVLLTTDDRLIKKSNRYSRILKVKVRNPVIWLAEEVK